MFDLDFHPTFGAEAVVPDAPGAGVAPTGLSSALLRHLVESRLSASVAGADDWAMRSLEQIQATAPSTVTATDTRCALGELESMGLIRSQGVDDASRWYATVGGLDVVNAAFRTTPAI